ncbi:FAD-binding oxidoreductase [Actinoplanes derwentensis]|uniref:Glycolate oxidase FAD binding subunit n=1 Tax=Actinoplanes derwentensis TaxID=113562 RepID=A0A1H2A536_9ACTN|nr:FAD-binding oxidoreductase [Actinoplanes derwentensis]SDT40576.1 glycolate oxidase FAD binding subunit [Actinoplanes derwentensis]
MSALDDLAVKAGDDDVVGGVQARLVAAPASTAEASALIAATPGLNVVIRGGGTKLQQGPPPRELDLIIDTRRLAGVVEHAAGDLITVVRAGTPMAELHRLPGQQLALDAPTGATAGGTVAANGSGPRRLRYGTARDLLIGVTVVRPDGRVAKAGGKVVKNVAGYDLGKLYTGSLGTLGLITECVFRLHPVPVATSFVRALAPPEATARILAGQFAPSAVEINAEPGAEPEIAVLLEGTPTGVHDRATALAALLDGEITTTAPPWWNSPPWPSGGLALKLTATLSRVPALVTAALEAGLTVRGSAGTGVLYAGGPIPARPALPGTALPPGTARPFNGPAPVGIVEALRAAATAAGGHAVVVAVPEGMADGIDMWGPVPGIELMRRVKEQFDPDHRFAPGRFVGGI